MKNPIDNDEVNGALVSISPVTVAVNHHRNLSRVGIERVWKPMAATYTLISTVGQPEVHTLESTVPNGENASSPPFQLLLLILIARWATDAVYKLVPDLEQACHGDGA